MKLDRLVLKEILGPWLFGVGLFSALLMAATYLGRLAGFFVDGAPPHLVLEVFGLYFPAILVKTFSMSVLLAALLAFGRLSSDSEIVALRAAGASLYRIIAPVLVFSTAVALVTFGFNEAFVPGATQEAAALTAQIIATTKITAANPIARTLVSHGKLKAAIVAKNVNPADQTLEGVTMVVYDQQGAVSFIMFANRLRFTSETQWRVVGGARIMSGDGRSLVQVPGDIWPAGVPSIAQSFAQITAARDDNFDSQSMRRLGESIARHRQQGDKTPADLHNYEYGYWNKLAVPLAAIVFGALGSVLGIRNHRTGAATGFALAVGIIFGYVTLANFMNVWAMGGVIPAWAASFAPLALGVVSSGVILWRRNA